MSRYSVKGGSPGNGWFFHWVACCGPVVLGVAEPADVALGAAATAGAPGVLVDGGSPVDGLAGDVPAADAPVAAPVAGEVGWKIGALAGGSGRCVLGGCPA
ncbi:MAG: hypothetical protein ACRDSN_19695, partial [Pseudonocardiaceae bacterium]